MSQRVDRSSTHLLFSGCVKVGGAKAVMEGLDCAT